MQFSYASQPRSSRSMPLLDCSLRLTRGRLKLHHAHAPMERRHLEPLEKGGGVRATRHHSKPCAVADCGQPTSASGGATQIRSDRWLPKSSLTGRRLPRRTCSCRRSNCAQLLRHGRRQGRHLLRPRVKAVRETSEVADEKDSRASLRVERPVPEALPAITRPDLEDRDALDAMTRDAWLFRYPTNDRGTP